MPGYTLQAGCPCGLKRKLHPGSPDLKARDVGQVVKVFACPHCGTLRDSRQPMDRDRQNEESARVCPRCGSRGWFLEDPECWHPPELRERYRGEIPWLAERDGNDVEDSEATGDWTPLLDRFRFTCPKCGTPRLRLEHRGFWD